MNSVTESDVYEQFMWTSMSIVDAVMALMKIGYDEREAERMVFEWVDAAEQDQDGETI